MKILYYDCTLGIKGEWNTAALLSLGIDEEFFFGELRKLNLCDFFHIESNYKNIDGFCVKSVSVLCTNKLKLESKDKFNFPYFERIIKGSSLNSYIKEKAMSVIKSIFEASANIYRIPLDEMVLEERIFIEYLINIVGAFICLDYLKPGKIICSKLGVGTGGGFQSDRIKIIPSAVVSKLLEECPVRLFSADFETIDEVGIAILNEIVDEFTENIDFTIEKTVYGSSVSDTTKSFLRIYSGITKESSDITDKTVNIEEDKQFIVECNIDDMNSELYDHIMKRIFDAGALDVYFTTIMMKKGRPAVKISVLCRKKDIHDINKVIFLETTTFGTRCYEVKKNMLERSFEKIDTQYGEVTVKRGFYEGKVIKAKPEYEDCKRIAERLGIPITEVYYNVIKHIEKL